MSTCQTKATSEIRGCPLEHVGQSSGQAAHQPFIPFRALLSSRALASASNGETFAESDLLESANACLAEILQTSPAVKFGLASLRSPRTKFQLLHISGDHIPTRIKQDEDFYERELLELLEVFYRPETNFLDVGANIGNHTLFFSMLHGASVIAFEPEPHNLICLEVNIRLNKVHDRVIVHRFAAGRARGLLNLHMVIEGNFGSFSWAAPKCRPGTCISTAIEVYPLDEVLPADAPISIMKVDVEGMEMDVFEGAASTIKRWHPLIACECANEDQFRKVSAILSEAGYEPVLSLNATPTFVFLTKQNSNHFPKWASYLAKKAFSGENG